ncbi:Surface antigen [Sphingomonas laterariae]|uniref:Surface antigen n=1 Tax=Edaphosphingomonas laterariae TaxID=861865 RepID=A0A239CBQ5_9SPHN|nr:BamA/TamA family outer membrane protein [Sphingomonas laterariae]SNS17676.1 Surface antigen [Sphingomonas laterariae]
MRLVLRGIALLALAGQALPAAAQDTALQATPGKQLIDQARTLTSDKIPAGDEAATAPSSKPDLVLAPIPVSSPAVGTGLAAAGVLFYNPNRSAQPWVSGVAGGYTSTDSWGVGLFHSMSFARDRLRFLGLALYGEANLDFYGIGPDAGAAGKSVELNDKAFAGLVDLEGQIFTKGLLRHLYFGGRVLYMNLDASAAIPLPGRPDLIPPKLERDSTIAMIGPAFTFDKRDNSTNPRKGVYVQGSLLYGAKWLGSDFDHHKLSIAGNAYFPLAKTTVLAFRKQACSVSGDAPYYDLCLFGQHGDLRGFEAGRYRDGASWAFQLEIRQHIAGRFGMVAFGGVGGIAENAKSVWKDSTVLGSGGIGLRYLASESANVNLRADLAWGKDGGAFYFGIGEAF